MPKNLPRDSKGESLAIVIVVFLYNSPSLRGNLFEKRGLSHDFLGCWPHLEDPIQSTILSLYIFLSQGDIRCILISDIGDHIRALML